MPAIVYVDTTGSRRGVDVPSGTTAMRAAFLNSVDGIVAECGGAAMCSTCHVYVDEAHVDRLPPMDEIEDEMLDSTACPRTPASRLACQFSVTDDLDGLVLHLPERQV